MYTGPTHFGQDVHPKRFVNGFGGADDKSWWGWGRRWCRRAEVVKKAEVKRAEVKRAEVKKAENRGVSRGWTGSTTCNGVILPVSIPGNNTLGS